MKNIIKILPLLIVTITVSLLVYKTINNNRPVNIATMNYSDSPMVGKKAPVSNGLNIQESDFLGKRTIINLFASWCVACQHEHPLFMTLKGDDSVQIIGVNWRDKKDASDTWLERHGDPYDKIVYDDIGKYGISLGIRGIPETYLVNEEGVIVRHYRGNIDQGFIDDIKAGNKE